MKHGMQAAYRKKESSVDSRYTQKGCFFHGNPESTHKFLLEIIRSGRSSCPGIYGMERIGKGSLKSQLPRSCTLPSCESSSCDENFDRWAEMMKVTKGNRVDFGEHFNQYELTFWGFAGICHGVNGDPE